MNRRYRWHHSDLLLALPVVCLIGAIVWLCASGGEMPDHPTRTTVVTPEGR